MCRAKSLSGFVHAITFVTVVAIINAVVVQLFLIAIFLTARRKDYNFGFLLLLLEWLNVRIITVAQGINVKIIIFIICDTSQLLIAYCNGTCSAILIILHNNCEMSAHI